MAAWIDLFSASLLVYLIASVQEISAKAISPASKCLIPLRVNAIALVGDFARASSKALFTAAENVLPSLKKRVWAYSEYI